MILLRINRAGKVIGEDHPRARLSDAQVDKIREDYEERGKAIKVMAREYKVSPRTIRRIVRYERRAQTCEGIKVRYDK